MLKGRAIIVSSRRAGSITVAAPEDLLPSQRPRRRRQASCPWPGRLPLSPAAIRHSRSNWSGLRPGKTSAQGVAKPVRVHPRNREMGLAKGDPQQRNGPPIQLPLTLVLDRNLEASSRPQGLRHPWTTAPGRFICPRDAVSALVGERVEDRYLACQLLDLSRPPTIWGVRRSFGCWLGVIIALSLVLPT